MPGLYGDAAEVATGPWWGRKESGEQNGPVSEYDAVVVGSGPNGLVAAVTLARTGRKVLVLEAAPTPGGGLRSAPLTLPGFVHDVCSAIHPLASGSPAMRGLPLDDHGLEWVHPDAPLAHPLDGGRAAVLERDLGATAAGLGADDRAYRRLVGPATRAGLRLVDGVVSPLALPPPAPLAAARFAAAGAWPARPTLRRRLRTPEARALLAGCAAHSILSLRAATTTGYGIFLAALGHVVGWPVARGGSQRIADALVALLRAHGGEVVTGTRVEALDDVPPAASVLLDLTPRQVLAIAGDALPARYRRRLARYRYGPGVFKVDWALAGPVPWAAPECRRAATVHVGGSFEEIVDAEEAVQRGRHPERPFVLLAQPTLFDPGRAPEGRHTAWAYCHVPARSTVDMTDAIEMQIERFAPGFRDLVLARHVMGPAAMEAHDANYVGGDINGGVADLRQFVARPVLSLHPWVTPVKGLYLCSSSTPPGGGVHGMCGWQAAQEVLRRDRPDGRELRG
jgi:phytoene dehydrogenase-like protein